MNKIHCFFEQSGTFKREFNNLGYLSYDYDILNDYNETDFQIDLFKEIEKAYVHKNSIFDNISSDDLIISFFPCIRFEIQSRLHFQGNAKQIKNHTLKEKLLYDLKLHNELSYLYEIITKLVLICIDRNIPLIIENPYQTTHYLTQYWCIKPTIIDYNRSLNGDYYIKPTQYWFINIEPKNNFIFEPIKHYDLNHINNISQKYRSLISSEYANRFIREYII